MKQKQKRIEILVKIFSFLLLPLVILIKPINAQAKYNGTPVMPQQVTMQNYADFGFSRTEGYEKVGYYIITNAEELYGFFRYCEKDQNALLMNDITVNDFVLDDEGELITTMTMVEWPMLTDSWGYKGIFDGNNHVISGLCQSKDHVYKLRYYYNGGMKTSVEYSLSGFITYANGATIKNLTITDSYFKNDGNVGDSAAVGAIVAYSTNTTIENCVNDSTVIGSHWSGGIVGTGGGTITNCINKGKVIGRTAGGIVGLGGTNVNKSINYGYIYGSSGAYGLGFANFTDCYNVGTVECGKDGHAAGVAAQIGQAKNCYNLGEVKGDTENLASLITNTEDIAAGYYTGYNNCYYLEGTGRKKDLLSASKTLEEFKSGEICFLLNERETGNDVAWRQTIGVDDFPIFDQASKIVYENGYAHGSEERGVSNTPPANGKYHELPNSIRKHNNYLEHYPAKEATCTEKGNIEYWHCSVCDLYFSDADAKNKIRDISGLTSNALGHDYATTWSTDKTSHWHECQRCGDKKDLTAHVSSGAATESKAEICTVCGYEISPILEHTHAMQLISAKSATCSELGNIAYYVCAKCKKYFQDSDGKVELVDLNSVVIPKLAHNYSTIWSNDDKNHWHQCEACGDKKDIAAHEYSDDMDTDCNVCGYTRTLKPKAKVEDVFSDVSSGDWFVNAAQFVYDGKFMNGVSTTKFAPLMTLTREQFITVLFNMEGAPKTKFKPIFDDVTDETSWFAESVTWAFDNEITSGIGNHLFGTGKNISREQLATLLYNYAQQKNEYKLTIDNSITSGYPDAGSISSWADQGMKWAITNGVMGGKPGKDGRNILDPQGNATRAECAQMIMNLKQKAVK